MAKLSMAARVRAALGITGKGHLNHGEVDLMLARMNGMNVPNDAETRRLRQEVAALRASLQFAETQIGYWKGRAQSKTSQRDDSGFKPDVKGWRQVMTMVHPDKVQSSGITAIDLAHNLSQIITKLRPTAKA